ncbi:hypothetical protein RI129_002872 [Pyrocoelia pectoralis]|uniref:Uncharacterized protein n=1 Tax=Pyrocoelia pectoralis TaxID=417401 RepID=A0AAN7VG21_9COLE
MRPDNISYEAKKDPLICLYGETLLSKHKRRQMSTVISNKMRELGRVLIVLKSICAEINGLFDALKPEMFSQLLSATKIVSGYNEETKSFKAPSLAVHMGTSLKVLCDIALKIVIEKRNLPNINWDNNETKKTEIKELKKLVVGHWCNDISSLALKSLKEQNWKKTTTLPLTEDIQKFKVYVCNAAENAVAKLSSIENGDSQLMEIRKQYRILSESILALTVLFNRKRIGEVQYLTTETYNSNTTTAKSNDFLESLTPLEKALSNNFKRVVVGGKGSKPVPILFSKKLQKLIEVLLTTRSSFRIVPTANPYLFANPGSENRWMSGSNVLRKLALKSGAKNPELLTSTRFRKQIATTLQLMTMEDNEMEQVATFMGHTKKTHSEFYRYTRYK